MPDRKRVCHPKSSRAHRSPQHPRRQAGLVMGRRYGGARGIRTLPDEIASPDNSKAEEWFTRFHANREFAFLAVFHPELATLRAHVNALDRDFPPAAAHDSDRANPTERAGSTPVSRSTPHPPRSAVALDCSAISSHTQRFVLRIPDRARHEPWLPRVIESPRRSSDATRSRDPTRPL